MSKDNVVSLSTPESSAISDPLTELLRRNAKRLVEVAVAAEFEEYLSAFSEERLPDGRLRVVRNGYLPVRRILTGIGGVEISVPKARSRSGGVVPFHSAVAPPFVRRAASLDAAIPWLYLRGVSTGGMREVVSALIGENAASGLSSTVVARLKREWWDEYHAWKNRGLDDDRGYLWTDGIHSGLRGDGGRLCALVVIGVDARGEKHFPAIEDGVRESAQSWRWATGRWGSGRRFRKCIRKCPASAAGLLRIPSQALGAPAQDQRDRIGVRHDPAQDDVVNEFASWGRPPSDPGGG